MDRALKIGLLFSLILFTTCIDKFPFTSEAPPRILNIEGYLTTLPKAHQIRLSRADRFGPEFNGLNRPEQLATVMIKDNLGNVEPLNEVSPGIYRTSEDFAAQVGRTYNLEIILFDGKRYISRPELVNPVPEMDSVTFQSVRTPSLDRMNDEIGVQIIAHFQDPAEEKNFYFWNILPSDFQVIAEPELNENGPFHPTCPRCPNPLDCCRVCYTKEVPRPVNIFVADDEQFNGIYQRRVIAYLRDNGIRFKGIFRLDMQHLSISQDAYRHLRLIDQHLRLNGSVFDAPPANIRGNMLNVEDQEEQVLGYFFVGDEKPIRIYIDEKKLEFVLRPRTLIPTTCLAFRRGVTTIPPLDWSPQ
jgi:hypothetical protein